MLVDLILLASRPGQDGYLARTFGPVYNAWHIYIYNKNKLLINFKASYAIEFLNSDTIIVYFKF